MIKQNTPVVQRQYVTNDDLQIIRRQVEYNTSMIEKTLEEMKEKNINSIISERYSKVLFVLLVLEHNLLLVRDLDISSDIKMLHIFAQNDIELYNIIHTINGYNKIHGIKYFEESFNGLVRTVSRRLYDADHPLKKFYKNYILPYVAYIAPNHSYNMDILYNADTLLKNGHISEFLQELEKLSLDETEIKELQKYTEELKKLVNVIETLDEVKLHIQFMLLNTTEIKA